MTMNIEDDVHISVINLEYLIILFIQKECVFKMQTLQSFKSEIFNLSKIYCINPTYFNLLKIRSRSTACYDINYSHSKEKFNISGISITIYVQQIPMCMLHWNLTFIFLVFDFNLDFMTTIDDNSKLKGICTYNFTDYSDRSRI